MDLDPADDPNKRVKRKMKFAPKAPPVREVKPMVKTEVEDDYKARELLRRFNDSMLAGKPKAERKVTPAQVAFGDASYASSMKYGAYGSKPYNQDQKDVKDYQDPWDYDDYHPVSLPLRRPGSGNPDILNEEEFGKQSEGTTCDESTSNPAKELGLLDSMRGESSELSMLLVQLPLTFPMPKWAAAKTGEGTAASAKPPSGAAPGESTCSLNELPAGHMGKMLVYKSGKVKLKLGDTLYDVSTGVDCVFGQDVVAINKKEKTCCMLGEVNKRASITPDVDSILSGMSRLG